MVVNAPTHRPVAAARRVGYAIAAALTGGLWYLLNFDPGWRAVPFLTDDTTRVLDLVNLSLWLGFAADMVYLMYDPRWLKSLGDVLTTGVGLAALVQLWRVFPFAFTGSVDWPLLVRVILLLGVAGSIVGIAVNMVALFRAGPRPGRSGVEPR